MRKCYRVENSEGQGPFYRTPMSKAWNIMMDNAFDTGKHPKAIFEIHPMAVFAFRELEDVDKWFDVDMRKELHNNGYSISVYKTPGFARNSDQNQVQFLKDGAKLTKIISLDY